MARWSSEARESQAERLTQVIVDESPGPNRGRVPLRCEKPALDVRMREW
jgi:hypothetical protein